MADSNQQTTDRIRSWGRGKFAAAALAFAAGVVVMLFGIAIEGVPMLAFTLFGVLPFVVGLMAFARVAWAHDPTESGPDPAREPLDELKWRYAAGEIEDDTLERKVETLLGAGERNPPRRRREDGDRERIREREAERGSR